jgi:hypothetical protein
MEADPGLSPVDIAMRVKARLRRQELLLHGKQPPQLDVLISEDVVGQPGVPPEVMQTQLDHLVTLADLPHVTLRVVPQSARLLGIQVRSFAILDFPEDKLGGEREPTTVQTDGWITPLYYTKPQEVTRYLLTYEELSKRSLDETASRGPIHGQRSCI